MDDVIGQRAFNKLAAGRQCTATSKQTGERCRRSAIVGGFVCILHGGRIPAVRRSARERLLAMVDPALDALLRALRQTPPCETCGRSDADRDPTVVRAAQLVLDRCGFGPTASLHVTTSAGDTPWLSYLSNDELEVIDNIFEVAKQRMESGTAPPSHAPTRLIEDGDVLVLDDPAHTVQNAEVRIPLGTEPPENGTED